MARPPRAVVVLDVILCTSLGPLGASRPQFPYVPTGDVGGQFPWRWQTTVLDPAPHGGARAGIQRLDDRQPDVRRIRQRVEVA